MPATLATLNAVTKEVYEGSMRKQLNDETITLNRIERTAKGTSNEVGGKYVTFPIHIGRNTGIGARNELELLPTPGQQKTAAARIGLKYLYGGVQLSGQAIKLVDANYNSFISALDLEMDGLKNDLAIDQNRQVYGTGKGTLGTAQSGTGGLDNNVFVFDDVKYFQDGMLVDVYTSADVLVVAGRTVTSITPATNTIIFSGASVTFAAGQYLVRAGNLNREWTGLAAIVSDTGLLYNINPSTVGLWKSEVNANGGTPRAVSEGLFTTMADAIRAKGGSVTAIFTTLGVRRQYADLLMQQRSFVNTTEFKGGFGGIAFTTDKGDIPIVVDTMAPKGTAWFLNEKNLKVYREADWSWEDYDGNKWARVPGYDAFEARMVQYSELGTDRRNTHGVIKDIAE